MLHWSVGSAASSVFFLLVVECRPVVICQFAKQGERDAFTNSRESREIGSLGVMAKRQAMTSKVIAQRLGSTMDIARVRIPRLV